MTQVELEFKEERRRRRELSNSICDSSEDSGVISLFQLALQWLQNLCTLHSKTLTFTGYSSSTRELDRAARKDLNEERRRSKLAEQEKKSREVEKAERLAKQRDLAKTLAATLRYTPSA